MPFHTFLHTLASPCTCILATLTGIQPTCIFFLFKMATKWSSSAKDPLTKFHPQYAQPWLNLVFSIFGYYLVKTTYAFFSSTVLTSLDHCKVHQNLKTSQGWFILVDPLPCQVNSDCIFLFMLHIFLDMFQS